MGQEYASDLVRLYKDVNVRDPKDFFKYLFGMKLKEKTGLHLDADGALLMTVIISHEPTAKDHLFLAELKEPLLKMRTVRQKVRADKAVRFDMVDTDNESENSSNCGRFKTLHN